MSALPNGKRTDRFQIQIQTHKSNVSNAVRTTFRKGKNGIEIVEMTKENLDPDQALSTKSLTLYPEMPSEEIKSLGNQDPAFKNFDIVKRSRCFLYLGSQYSSGFYEVTYGFGAYIFNTIHLPGLRGNPERTYKLTSTGPQYPGTFENYAAGIINEWQETGDERLETLADTLHTLGLTGQVGTKKIGDTRIELQVGRLPLPPASGGEGGGTDMVSIADVGFGVSQVLPVLVALIVAEPGRLVYLEQPEMHLHPRAQVALARVLADAAKSGVRVVAETHSSLAAFGGSNACCRRRSLAGVGASCIGSHAVTDGATKIDTADLDEAGAYGDWPEDFDDVDLKAQSRYLNAADRVAFGKTEAS